MIFTADLLISIILLLIHHKSQEVKHLAERLMALFEDNKNKQITSEGEVLDIYANIIHELLSDDNVNESKEFLDTLLLKYKTNKVIQNDPEIYTRLKAVVLESSTLTDDHCEALITKLENALNVHNTTALVKKLYGCAMDATTASTGDKQGKSLSKIKDLCSEIIQIQEEQAAKKRDEENDLRLTELDFADRDGLRKAFQVHKTIAETNLFKTGLQGLNKALGGGFKLGEAIVLNSLPHNGKFLKNSEPILTPAGTKPIGELVVGDEVLAWDGSVSKVTGVYPQGKKDLYNVRLVDNRVLAAGDEHLWTFWVNNQIITGTTLDMKEAICRGFEVRIPLRTPSVKEVGDFAKDISLIDKFMPTEDMSSEQRRKAINLIQRFGGYCYEKDDGQWDIHLDRAKFTGQHKRVLSIEDSIQVIRIEGTRDREECTCISIDHPDKLYVTGNFVVTHNTMALLKFTRWMLTLNKVGPEFKNPLCLFISLENEIAQNTKLLFDELWIAKYNEVPPKDISEEEAINFITTEFSQYGWHFVMKRKLGADYGFHQFQAEFEDYVKRGYTPMLCAVDYMDMMNKGPMAADGSGNHLHIKLLYTNMCNFLKSKNCTLVTAHQLNRLAAEVARQSPVGAVKKFDVSMLAGSMDPQREVDVVIYAHIEKTNTNQAFWTFRLAKHRYEHSVPEHLKYFAYEFEGELGVRDDLQFPDGKYVLLEDKSTQNIYAKPKKNVHGDAVSDGGDSIDIV